jgi:hypothetical protein
MYVDTHSYLPAESSVREISIASKLVDVRGAIAVGEVHEGSCGSRWRSTTVC